MDKTPALLSESPRPCRAEECVWADQRITPGVRHPVRGLAVCGGNPVENEASVLPPGKLGSPRLCGRPGWTEPPAFPCVKGMAASCLPCARQRRGSAAEEAGASGRRGGQRVTAAGAEQSGGSTLPAVLAAPGIPGLVVTALQSLPLFSHDLCPHAPNLTLLSLSRSPMALGLAEDHGSRWPTRTTACSSPPGKLYLPWLL
ncbi:uncharacterized protein LOC122234003 [Panthera tigris]|uniref:uncharacterized protein LOC122234003 n=1 Tax=Panthera tigris TaxID=9694 RepID=UPI001C6FAD4A|nr:uncharacterized protein LOC122234003 [Panthera tigris]